MKVTINQSNYLPWKGYFDLVHDADVFIFLDDVQFTTNDWRNRNQIYGPNGVHWLTIPVGSSINRKICEVPLPAGPWREKHRRSLRQAYANAPYFSRYESLMDEIYAPGRWQTLSELNQHIIRKIAQEHLGLKTHFCSSQEFGCTGSNQDRVLELLHAVKATTYFSGPAARAYLDEDRFRHEGIQLVWKDYSGYPSYSQLQHPFVHQVSIIDLLFCTGPRAAEYIWGWRESERRLS